MDIGNIVTISIFALGLVFGLIGIIYTTLNKRTEENAEEIKDSERQSILELYLSKHPYLEDFVRSPSCALIRVTARSFYMVQNFQNVMEFHIDR